MFNHPLFWPEQNEFISDADLLAQTNLILNKTTVLAVKIAVPKPPCGLILSNFSSLKAVKIFRSLGNQPVSSRTRAQKRQIKPTPGTVVAQGDANLPSLSLPEIESARLLWLLFVQAVSYPNELKLLSAAERSAPLIKQLDLFLDSRGLICCRGRLENSSFPDSAKHCCQKIRNLLI